MATFSETFEQSWSELEDSTLLSSSIGLLDLPSEVLLLVLRYLPLSDLANARLVSYSVYGIVGTGACIKFSWAMGILRKQHSYFASCSTLHKNG